MNCLVGLFKYEWRAGAGSTIERSSDRANVSDPAIERSNDRAAGQAMGFIALPLTTSPWVIGHPMTTVTHMISIVVNHQLEIFKIFNPLCLPLLPYMMVTKKSWSNA